MVEKGIEKHITAQSSFDHINRTLIHNIMADQPSIDLGIKVVYIHTADQMERGKDSRETSRCDAPHVCGQVWHQGLRKENVCVAIYVDTLLPYDVRRPHHRKGEVCSIEQVAFSTIAFLHIAITSYQIWSKWFILPKNCSLSQEKGMNIYISGIIFGTD